MKKFKSEFAHSYATYSFGYCEYAVLDVGDSFGPTYSEGFLPYSGAPHIERTLYMARSARINTSSFSLNSENRRVLKRFDETLTRTIVPIADFDTNNETFRDFCLNYFSKRHGENVMPKERFETILQAGFITHIVVYTDSSANIVGYVFLCNDTTMSHFWFSFYDLSYAYQSLGLWLMLDCARYAQEQGLSHFYIGTVYGEKALYKTNFEGLEFWNGEQWIPDTKLLRTIARNDHERIHDGLDRWKETHDTFVSKDI